ncbi:MAG TPA: hypothetical protein VG146_13505 [Verrucomicrobiae bacterium]|nr:hypothetical protein [Verrucomicrobiae bacterium]
MSVIFFDDVMLTDTYDYLNRLPTPGYPDGGVEHFGYSAAGVWRWEPPITPTIRWAI